MISYGIFCPNSACPARGQADQGNIRVHSQREHRYRCVVCCRTFVASQGTPLYRLHHDRQQYLWTITLLAYGCPTMAIVRTFGVDERTVRQWHHHAGMHCQQVQQTLVETPREQGQVQVDELHIKTHGSVVWVACAIAVASRLWLGAAVRSERSRALATAILTLVRQCVVPQTFWLCVDGWRPYVTAARRVFRQSVARRGAVGRCCLAPWPELVVVQVVKHSVAWRLVGIVRHVALGTWPQAFAAFRQTQGYGVFCTSWIERLNVTFRSRLHAWVRRGRARLRSPEAVLAATYLVGTVYNFCTPHTTLSCHRVPTTPAMAATITTTIWSLERLLTYHARLPMWEPPAHCGRKSLQELTVLARWCPTRLSSSERRNLRLHTSV